ncbi:MAG: hypothetical protein ACUVWP_03970 [bacterium]
MISRKLVTNFLLIIPFVNVAFGFIYSTSPEKETLPEGLATIAIDDWKRGKLASFDRISVNIPKPTDFENISPEKLENIYNDYFDEVSILRNQLESQIDEYIKSNPFNKSIIEWEKKANEDNIALLDPYLDNLERLKLRYFSKLKKVDLQKEVVIRDERNKLEMYILIGVFIISLGLIVFLNNDFRSLFLSDKKQSESRISSAILPLLLAMSIVSVGGFITGMFRYAIFINLILSTLIIIMREKKRRDERKGRKRGRVF